MPAHHNCIIKHHNYTTTDNVRRKFIQVIIKKCYLEGLEGRGSVSAEKSLCSRTEDLQSVVEYQDAPQVEQVEAKPAGKRRKEGFPGCLLYLYI